MKTLFKTKAGIILLIIVYSLYSCGPKPGAGANAPTDSATVDTSHVAVVPKPAKRMGHHHKKVGELKKTDTLNIVADTTKPIITVRPADTLKKNASTIAGKLPIAAVAVASVPHFTMRRIPAFEFEDEKQQFMLVKKAAVKPEAELDKNSPPPAPAPEPESSPAPAPLPPPPVTTAPVVPAITKPKDLKFGILGYSYPPNIVVGESKDIHAFISIVYPTSKVKDTLLKISVADDPANSKDSIDIFEPMRLYKYVTLTLIPTDSSIKVINYPQVDARQEIDTLEGNKWSWGILATTADQPVSKLKLIISTEDPQNYAERTIPVYIKVNPHFFRKIYDFLMGDPNVLVVSILIPLATFIGGLLFAKRKKKA